MIDGERGDGDDDFASRIDPESGWGDPEARWGNPEHDLPNIPSVRIPSTEPEPDPESESDENEFTADVDPEQMRLFWGSVFLANVALAGLTVGPMLIYFRNEWLFGGGAVVLGVAAFARVYTMYGEYKSTDWERVKAEKEDEDHTETSDSESDTDESPDADDGERNP